MREGKSEEKKHTKGEKGLNDIKDREGEREVEIRKSRRKGKNKKVGFVREHVCM